MIAKIGSLLHRAVKADVMKALLVAVVSLAAIGLVFYVDIPRRAAMAFRYDTTRIVGLIVLLYGLIFHLRGWWRAFFGLATTFVLFLLPIIGLWSFALRDTYVVGSLLPIGDANLYYWDIARLLEGFRILSSSWRPLYPGFMAAIMGLVGQSLQSGLAIQGLFSAVAVYLAACEIRRTQGIAPGVIIILVLYIFYRDFSGKLLTEGLGLPLGVLAFALFWRGSHDHRLLHVILGIFVMALGFAVRPGPMLALPAIVLWAVWLFRNPPGRISLPVMVICIAAAILPLLLNNWVAAAVASPSNSGSTFYLFVYGQAVGGKGFKQAVIDHPELYHNSELSSTEISNEFYKLAWDAVREDPSKLGGAVLRAWGSFFSLSREGMYGFIGKEGAFSSFVLRLLFFLLAAISIVGTATSFKQSSSALVLAVAVGVVLSIPFVPPWDWPGMRHYAVVIPFFGAYAALGAGYLIQWIRPLTFLISKSEPWLPASLVVYSVSLVALTILAPLLVHLQANSSYFAPESCPQGDTLIHVRLNPGSSIMIVENDAVAVSQVPYIRKLDFDTSNQNFGYFAVAEEFEQIQPPSVIYQALELEKALPVYMIVPSTTLNKATGVVTACGKWGDDPDVGNWFFYANRITPVSIIE